MITLREILEEARKNLPEFKKGQYFEILKSIYPVNENKENRNIVVNGRLLTKPSAVDKKTKREFIKHNSPLKDFFNNKTKGDIVQVIEVNNDTAKCINLNLNEEIKEKYYKNHFIFLSYEDIINGTIKQVKRNVEKYTKQDGGK